MSDADSGRGNERQTLIEAGTTFRGSFASDCPIVVKGRIEGEVSGPSLTVSATGAVSGTVKVTKLCSDGELSGEYDADVVQLSGVIKDNTVIRARSLEVKLSPERGRMQVVFGECDLEVGDVPSAQAAVADAKRAVEPAPTTVEAKPPGENGATVEAEAEAEANTPTDPPPPPAREDHHGRKRKREGRSSTIPTLGLSGSGDDAWPILSAEGSAEHAAEVVVEDGAADVLGLEVRGVFHQALFQQVLDRTEDAARDYVGVDVADEPEAAAVLEGVANEGVEVAVELAELRVDVVPETDGLAQDDAAEGAMLEDGADDAGHRVDELLLDGGGAGGRVDADDRGAEDDEQLVEQLEEDGVLALEVEVERAARDAGGIDDVADARVVIALLGEDFLGRRQDVRAPALALRFGTACSAVGLADRFGAHVRLRSRWRLERYSSTRAAMGARTRSARSAIRSSGMPAVSMGASQYTVTS